MNDLILRAYIAVQSLQTQVDGQDLVEYALVVGMLAFGTISGTNAMATAINHEFSQVAVTITSGTT